jgi:hypothetical protein
MQPSGWTQLVVGVGIALVFLVAADILPAVPQNWRLPIRWGGGLVGSALIIIPIVVHFTRRRDLPVSHTAPSSAPPPRVEQHGGSTHVSPTITQNPTINVNVGAQGVAPRPRERFQRADELAEWELIRKDLRAFLREGERFIPTLPRERPALHRQSALGAYDQSKRDLDIWLKKASNRMANWRGGESEYFRNCPNRSDLRTTGECHLARLREVLGRLDDALSPPSVTPESQP